MSGHAGSRQSVPRIEKLKVKSYRALKDIEFNQITPLSVFLGPNGSGKSTIFDVFAFMSECFNEGLRKAWDRRGRFKELRTRDVDGPISIELQYREKRGSPLITYHLSINESGTRPYVENEWLSWKRGKSGHGRPFHILSFAKGSGYVLSGEMPEEEDKRIYESLDSDDMLAVNSLGQFSKHPRVGALRRFITGWHLSYLTADNTRGTPEAGPQERLSATGDNLPNVIQYLIEQHPDRLNKILSAMSRRVPMLEKVDAEMMQDGRLLLQIKDAPFSRPVLSKYASDGTLKMLAYLTLLYDPDPPQLVGIEEPENHLHPRLLPELAEECRNASGETQLMVTTHSPFLINGVRADELWVLYRDKHGHTNAKKASDMLGINDFLNNGANLGDLWMEGHFEFGDPLHNSGGPRR